MRNRIAIGVSLFLLLAGMASPLAAQAPENIQAARQLLVAMNLEEQHRKLLAVIIAQQTQKHPEIGSYRPQIDEFVNKNLSWSCVRDDLAKVYAQEFTTEELKQLEQFYRTPVGAKYSEKLPQMFGKAAAVFQQRAQKCMPELFRQIKNEIVRKKMAELKR